MKRTITLKVFLAALAVAFVAALSAPAQAADTISAPVESSLAGDVDFANAKPLDLPQADYVPPAGFDLDEFLFPGEPGASAGRRGTGEMTPVRLPKNVALAVEPQEFGSSLHPFTTSRVDLPGNLVSRYWPYRIAGKLFFKIGTANYVCSASLIKKGIIVTAAHCVFEYGKKTAGWHTAFQFVPAYYNGVAPYGVWGGVPRIMTSYYAGTDTCSTPGIVCKNDVAIISVTPQSGRLPGTSVGWFGYGWDGYGFTGQNLALITQLGYPVSHDSGLLMQRTDSQGFVSGTLAGNTVWGSRQTGGSSGGPELANFGAPAVLSGTGYGAEAALDIVVGVTSWGYTSTAIKQQGASPFLSTNIKVLVDTACAAAPLNCAP